MKILAVALAVVIPGGSLVLLAALAPRIVRRFRHPAAVPVRHEPARS